jgi:hypothetical protein
VPAAIVTIRRTGRNTAAANVRMSFEPSQIFQDFENFFDEIQSAGQTLSLNTGKQQGKMVQVTFQRYADGWHMESVD